MRTLDRKKLISRARALEVCGVVSKGVDTKLRDEGSRRSLVIADAVSIKKAVDFGKFVRVKDGVPLGGKNSGRSKRVIGKLL